ncbi:MAG TPA: hypothetical protein VN828_01660 [Acidobacteriaceae bacterium]|nr:hypothetical protein [Acidobacteriaceae bacterium]
MKSFGFVVGMGIAGAMAMFSTQANAQMTCSICEANYEACIAAGGSNMSCWNCNNPLCPPPARSIQKSATLNNPVMKKDRVAIVASR